MRTTHTYVVMEISKSAFDEIKTKMEAAGYQHAFIEEKGEPMAIDMHGIAVQKVLVKTA